MNVGCSIDAEWVMEKKHWRESVRQERAATPARRGGTRSSGNPSDIPGSSSTGDRGMGTDGTDDANAYLPEMDEMRCLLWAHGGSFHGVFLLPFSW